MKRMFLTAVMVAGALAVPRPALAVHAFSPEYHSISQVIDNGNLLRPQLLADLRELVDDTEYATGRQMVIVVLPSLGQWKPDVYARYVAEQAGLAGAKPGVLMLVSKAEKQVAFSMAPGVDRFLTPVIMKHILKDNILPELKHGDLELALRYGARGLADGLLGEYLTASEKRMRYLPFLVFFPFVILMQVLFGHGNAERIFGGGAWKKW